MYVCLGEQITAYGRLLPGVTLQRYASGCESGPEPKRTPFAANTDALARYGINSTGSLNLKINLNYTKLISRSKEIEGINVGQKNTALLRNYRLGVSKGGGS